MCTARLGDSTGLICDNPNPHEPHHGCTFTASSLNDKHDASEQRAEDKR